MTVRRTTKAALIILLIVSFPAQSFFPSVRVNEMPIWSITESTVWRESYAPWGFCGFLTLLEIVLLLRFHTLAAGIVGMVLDLLKNLLPLTARCLNVYITGLFTDTPVPSYTALPFAFVILCLAVLTLLLYARLIIGTVREKKRHTPTEPAAVEDDEDDDTVLL